MNLDNEEIIVSIGMLTYNQAEYIRQALDGILMQETDFRYEVIVGDDASSDGTQEILKEYQKKYKDIFRLVLRSENIGVTRNSFDLKYRAKGKYFACLEGDDYWIDANKLQMQVDFMESHPEYIACVHKCRFVDDDNKPIKSIEINGYYCNEEIYTIKEFERGELPGQTATLIYRNIFLDKTKDFSILYKANSRIGDKTMILLLLSYGNIYNINRVMSCYRYIITPNGKNVSSNYIGKNNRDELMEYLCVLEEYAKKELGIQLNMVHKKKDYFVAAVTVMLREPTKHNKIVVKKMLKRCEKKTMYYCLMIKTIVIKIIGWKLLKRDIRIKY